MSMLLWIDEEKDEALDLGDPFTVFTVLAELHSIDPSDEWSELQSIPDFAEQDPDPEWLAKVNEQAASFLKEHRDELSEEAVAFLLPLAGGGLKDGDSDFAPRFESPAPSGGPITVIKNFIQVPPVTPPAIIVPPPVVVKGEPGPKGDKGEPGDPGGTGPKGEPGQAIVAVEQIKPREPKTFVPKAVVVERDDVTGAVEMLIVKELTKKPVGAPPAKE